MVLKEKIKTSGVFSSVCVKFIEPKNTLIIVIPARMARILLRRFSLSASSASDSAT